MICQQLVGHSEKIAKVHQNSVIWTLTYFVSVQHKERFLAANCDVVCASNVLIIKIRGTKRCNCMWKVAFVLFVSIKLHWVSSFYEPWRIVYHMAKAEFNIILIFFLVLILLRNITTLVVLINGWKIKKYSKGQLTWYYCAKLITFTVIY